jgi:hypothetical protein
MAINSEGNRKDLQPRPLVEERKNGESKKSSQEELQSAYPITAAGANLLAGRRNSSDGSCKTVIVTQPAGCQGCFVLGWFTGGGIPRGGSPMDSAAGHVQRQSCPHRPRIFAAHARICFLTSLSRHAENTAIAFGRMGFSFISPSPRQRGSRPEQIDHPGGLFTIVRALGMPRADSP